MHKVVVGKHSLNFQIAEVVHQREKAPKIQSKSRLKGNHLESSLRQVIAIQILLIS
jgi:hypothetical protein